MTKYWIGLSSVLSVLFFSLFQIKYTVLDLENEHKELRRQIRKAQEEFRVLNAEWTYLNDPERLFQLSQKHLKLRPIRGQQLKKYSDIHNSGLGIYDRKELEELLHKDHKTANPSKKESLP